MPVKSVPIALVDFTHKVHPKERIVTDLHVLSKWEVNVSVPSRVPVAVLPLHTHLVILYVAERRPLFDPIFLYASSRGGVSNSLGVCWLFPAKRLSCLPGGSSMMSLCQGCIANLQRIGSSAPGGVAAKPGCY